MENGYDGAVSYRVGEDGQWKQVFPDESGRYTIPEEEISGDIYLEYHP